MTQELTILKQENVQMIVSDAPKSYQDNKASCEKCIARGNELLKMIEQQGGLTDQLDADIAKYLGRVRETVKAMNTRRSPFTKLFDDIRKEFTLLENTVDPTRTDTVPYRLQQTRNQYAAKKRQEEEKRRREELARQQAEQARKQMVQDIEDDFNNQFNSFINSAVNTLTGKDNDITLENFDVVAAEIKDYPVELPADFLFNLHTYIRLPAGISADELRKAEMEVKESLAKKFKDMYSWELQDTKDYILDRLPSKKSNLERIAKSNAEEAARLKAEMEEKLRREAAAKEEERKRKEEEDAKQKAFERQQDEFGSLFGAQAATVGHPSKVKVSKKINLLNPEGIMPILSMWWSKEGCMLSVDELSKMFKKQITYCEKIANKEDIFIEDESVEYIDDVKAR